MNQSQSQMRSRSSSFKNGSNSPNRQTVLNWIKQLSSCDVKTIEQLGDGQAYCRMMNHYVPNTILDNRIVARPRNEYQSCLNLKQFQLALVRLKINIPFDLRKVAKQNFNENWTLIVLLYKHMQGDLQKKQSEVPSAKAPANEPELASQKIIFSQKQERIIQQSIFLPNVSLVPPRSDLWAIIDRTKQILLSNCNNTEKIRQIRQQYSLEEVKEEEDLQVLSPYVFHKG